MTSYLEHDLITGENYTQNPPTTLFTTESLDALNHVADQDRNYCSVDEINNFNFTFADLLDNEDYTAETYLSLDKLRRMLKIIDDSECDTVKIRAGNHIPLVITGIDSQSLTSSEHFARATVAPKNPDKCNVTEYFSGLENYFGNYYVYSLGEQSDWSDKYPYHDQAVDAAEEHRYLTGNHTRIVYPDGTEKTI